MEQRAMRDPIVDDDRVRAEAMLDNAQVNPVLSGTQACDVAQVHALLAIEQRLAQVCASLDAVLTVLVGLSLPDDATVAASPSLTS